MAATSFRKCHTHLYLCALISCFLHHHGAEASTFLGFVSSASYCRDNVVSSLHPTLAPNRRHHNAHKQKLIDTLSATSDGNENNKAGNTSSRSARDAGIYARPSAAIEKGSGFFIPGLEGSRIRFLFGITVLVADASNHVLVGGEPGDWGQVVAECMAAFYGAFLLLQGSIEMGVEKGFAQGRGGGENVGIISGENEDGASILNRGGGGSSRVADTLRENGVALEAIQRMAQTITTFTPATNFQFAAEDLGVLYSVCVSNDDALGIDVDEQKRLVNLALDAVSGSRGGRVALPSEHPVSKLLPESATRCILVQKVEGYQKSTACMIIGSNKLLPSFTKNDLRWIGQLSEYNKLMGDES